MSDRRPPVRAALDFLCVLIGPIAGQCRLDVGSMQPVPPFGRCLTTADGGFHEKFASFFRGVWRRCRRPVVFARRCRLRAGRAETPDKPRPCPEHRSDQYRRRPAPWSKSAEVDNIPAPDVALGCARPAHFPAAIGWRRRADNDRDRRPTAAGVGHHQPPRTSRRHRGRSARSAKLSRPSFPSAMTFSIAHPSWRCHCH